MVTSTRATPDLSPIVGPATTDEARLDRAIADLVLRYTAEGPYETRPLLPTEAALAAVRDEVAALARQVAALPPSLLTRHFAALLDGIDAATIDDLHHPGRPLAALVRYLTFQVWEERRPRRRRLATLAERLGASERLLPLVEALARRGGPGPAGEAVEAATSLQHTLGRAGREVEHWAVDGAGRLAARMQELAAEAVALAERLRGVEAPLGEPLPRLPYAELLRRRHGVPLEELLAWHEAEIAACAERFRAVGRALDPDADPAHLLWRRSPAYPSARAMFAAARECLAVARERALDLISLPAGEVCRVAPMPKLIQASFPWGGAYGPSVARGLLWGKWFCNQANFRAVTRGWVQMMAIHECYPGHHAHRVKTVAGALPLTFKHGRLAGTTPLSEGICHRAETQLQHIYDDPIFPLFVAYRRLHTAVRIKADLSLHHFGRPRAEAVALYVDWLRFDERSASGQVRYQELHPGYMTCYYYGCRQLERWRAELPLDDRTFTDTTFSLGYVTLPTLQEVLATLVERADATGTA